MTKVALLIDEFFGAAGTAFGGYGLLARNYIAKYIPGDSFSVDVLLDMKGEGGVEEEKVDGVSVFKLPSDKSFVRDWLAKKDYDVFFSIELTWPSYEILDCLADIDKKLVLWIQDPRPKSAWDGVIDTMQSIKDPSFFFQPVYDLVRRMTEQGRVEYISQGYTLNPLALELYNIPTSTPIRYVPNPINIDEGYEFDINRKKRQVIFLGRLEAQKRAWLFCEVAKRMPEYDFFVLGRMFRHMEDNERMLAPYMKGDIPNLHFLGHVDGEKKEKLIRESRLLLNTSIWEGIPISWLECLQYGTPVVSCIDNERLASRFGAYVGNINGDGFDSVDLFVPEIRKLMEDDELYAKKAAAAIKYVRETHNIGRFRKDVRSVLAESAGKSRRFESLLKKFAAFFNCSKV